MIVIGARSIRPRDGKSCPYCDEPPHISFNWQYLRRGGDPENRELWQLATRLEPGERLKAGRLYHCSHCGQPWYLDAAEAFMHRVPEERDDLLAAWNERRLRPTAEQLEVLAAIGGTERDVYGNGAGSIKVPCRAVCGDRIIDPAIVRIDRRPPIDEDLGRVELLDPEARLEPSGLALPLEVRVASEKAEEIRMGFSPTSVRSPSGEAFVLNGSTQVFHLGEHRGRDLRLTRGGSERDQSPPAEAVEATWLWADWFEGCEELIRWAPPLPRRSPFLQALGASWAVSWRIVLFFLVWAMFLAPGLLLFAGGEVSDAGAGPAPLLPVEALGAAAVLAAGWVMLRFVDRRPFVSLGFVARGAPRELALGVLIGAAMIALAVAALWLPGWAATVPPDGFSWKVLALLAGALLCNSVTQEVLVRGYVLQTVEARFSTPVALIASSLVFVALHAGALVEGGLLPAVNLLGAGLLLGLAYTTTRRLWLPIGLHLSWNLLQGPVLGIAVSGQALDGGWRLLALEGPALFTGGPFGLEGGLAGTLATAAGIAAVAVLGRRRHAPRPQTGRAHS